MIGSNTLILNQATMAEAVQFWLNAQMVKPPRVELVSAKDVSNCEIRLTTATGLPPGSVTTVS